MIDRLISVLYPDKTRIIDRKRWYDVVGEKENCIIVIPYETRMYNNGKEKVKRKSLFPKRVDKIGVKYKGRIIIRGTEYWPAGDVPDCADDGMHGINVDDAMIDGKHVKVHGNEQPEHIPKQVQDREYESDQAIPGSIPESVKSNAELIMRGSVDHEYLLRKWNEKVATTSSSYRAGAFEEAIHDLMEELNDELSGGYMYNGGWGEIESVEFNNSDLVMKMCSVDESEIPDLVKDEAESMYNDKMIIVTKING